MQSIGTLIGIQRFPVKGMAGESLDPAEIGPRGIEGDRRYAFQRVGSLDPFPYLGVSKLAEMVHYKTRWTGSEHGDIEVTTPDGQLFDVKSEALREHLSAVDRRELRLTRIWRGAFDENPLSLIGTATLDALARETGVPMDARRFRMNFVVQTDTPFIEDTWIGNIVCFGEGDGAPSMHIVMRDMRCSMINVDPDTGAKNAAVLKTVTQKHDACAGVYGDPFRGGVVRVGVPVFIA